MILTRSLQDESHQTKFYTTLYNRASRAHFDRWTKDEKSPVDGQFKVISNVTLRKVASIYLDLLYLQLLNVSIHMFYVKYYITEIKIILGRAI